MLKGLDHGLESLDDLGYCLVMFQIFCDHDSKELGGGGVFEEFAVDGYLGVGGGVRGRRQKSLFSQRWVLGYWCGSK